MTDLPERWALRSATAAATHRPLPALWDGPPVEWRLWEPYVPVFMCDRSRRTVPPPEVCPGCGALWHPASSTGLIKRPWERRPMADLIAWRCPECGHDQVYDRHTDQSWDLDDTDYGPEGSIAPS